jgi:hypothetical protein
MSDNFVGSDDELMAELAMLMEGADPVPALVVAAAKSSLAYRDLDEELAALIYDSDFDDGSPLPGRGELARVRGGGTRRLTFEGPDLTVELKLQPERRLIGQLVPPQEADVEISSPGGSFIVRADELGRFVAPDVPTGPVSLRCRGQRAARPTQTEWVTL